MSMAISPVSAYSVPAMLNPVTKLTRVPKVDPSHSNTASATTKPQSTVQGASRPQPADTPSITAEQAHATFMYARMAWDNMGMPNTMAQSNADEGQSSGVQQAGSAYAQAEQQTSGQVVDFTA